MPAYLARTGLALTDFDRIEINEAFAAQVLACTRALGLADDAEHVNANGGALALGHPLGASGARVAMTAAYALRDEMPWQVQHWTDFFFQGVMALPYHIYVVSSKIPHN